MKSRGTRNAVIATYESRASADVAFHALRRAGLDVTRLAVQGGSLSIEEQAKRLAVVGVPPRRAVTYEHAVKRGKFLVLVGGSARGIGQACALLGTTGPSQLTAYAPNNGEAATAAIQYRL